MREDAREFVEKAMNAVLPYKHQKLTAGWIKERIGKAVFPRYTAYDVLETDSDGNPVLYDATDDIVANILCHCIFRDIEEPLEFCTPYGRFSVPNIWEFDLRVREIRKQGEPLEKRVLDEVGSVAVEWKSHTKEFKAEYERRIKLNMEGMLNVMRREDKLKMEIYRNNL